MCQRHGPRRWWRQHGMCACPCSRPHYPRRRQSIPEMAIGLHHSTSASTWHAVEGTVLALPCMPHRRPLDFKPHARARARARRTVATCTHAPAMPPCRVPSGPSHRPRPPQQPLSLGGALGPPTNTVATKIRLRLLAALLRAALLRAGAHGSGRAHHHTVLAQPAAAPATAPTVAAAAIRLLPHLCNLRLAR